MKLIFHEVFKKKLKFIFLKTEYKCAFYNPFGELIAELMNIYQTLFKWYFKNDYFFEISVKVDL